MNSLINIINPSAMVFDKNIAPTKKVEQIARVCYKSEDKIGDMTDCKMIEALLKNDHTAMIEHASLCIAVRKDFYFYMLSHLIEWHKRKFIVSRRVPIPAQFCKTSF